MREEQREERVSRKKRKKEATRECARKALELQEFLHERNEAYDEEMRKQELERRNNDDMEEVGGKHTREVINPPPEGSGEWLPYESDDEFGTELELKRTNWEVEKFTLELARCVVGLESFVGDKKLFTCIGTIIEFCDNAIYVVTSGSLVTCPDKNVQVDEPKINVWLANGEILEGFVSNVDLYYNICLIEVPSSLSKKIEVPSTFHLLNKSFSPDTGFFNFYDDHPKDVVALGRTCESWSLMVSLGKLIPRRSKFDCEELFVSSCKVSKRGVGGPLINFDGHIIGMSFYDKKGTPFLPGFIVLKCLQHFKNFGKAIRPLHGLRVKNVHDEDLNALENKIQCGFTEVYGVIVEKIENSSVKDSGINAGDVITHDNGVPFSNAAELRVRRYKACKSEITTQTIDVNKFTPCDINRWPLPRPIIERLYVDGKLVEELRWSTADT